MLTTIGLTLGGSSTEHIYTQTVHRTTQITILIGRLSGIRTQIGQNNWEECRPCPIFASYTLAFSLQLRKKHGKTSVRVEKNLSQGRKNLSQGVRFLDLKLSASPNKNLHLIWLCLTEEICVELYSGGTHLGI